MRILALTDFMNNRPVEKLHECQAINKYKIFYVSSNQSGWQPKQKKETYRQIPNFRKYIIKSNIITSLPYVYNPVLPFSLNKLIKKQKIDIIHSHYIFFFTKIAYILKKFSNIPLVISIRGFNNDFHNFALNISSSIYYKTLLNKIVNNADFLIVQTQDTIERMIQAKIKIPSKYEIITNGVNTDYFRPISKVKSQYINRPLMLGFVGRIVKIKGVWELIIAVKRLLLEGKNIKLSFFGTGDQELLLKQYVKNNDILRTKVTFHGFQTNLKDVYNKLDLFILPSETEGSSNALMEAMACGIPVIATTVGATPDILKSYPYLIPPCSTDQLKETIEKMIEKRNSFEEIGMKLRRIILQKYSWRSVTQKTMEVYESVMQNSSLKG